jgi:type III restriction enzyme
MINLREYQEKYVGKLKSTVNDMLESEEEGVCVFKSPTGSGKTVMTAEFLKRLITGREDNKKFSFIWISVRKLHTQSKNSLEYFYEDSQDLKCSYFNDLIDKKIDENEILFINWESINKTDKNTIIKENEQNFYLESVVNNTKEEGREIILIIDESHHTASSSKSRELIQTISPIITLEVSATPHLKEDVEMVKVPLKVVKDEGIIKKEVTINPEFNKIKITDKNEDESVIKQALDKRKELVKLFKKEGTDINPLILIQLPDKKQLSEDKQGKVLGILKKLGVTEENGKLAIWLSEQKSETLANIEKKENEVEVLIFKQAIALGWDCPRAHILVIFREYKNFEFTIQTIGRIMRMPELRHYDDEELNKGFIFTNLSNLIIEEDYAKDYLTTYESKRDNKKYRDINLYSIHFRRQRERTRLSGEFIKIFQKIAKEMKLKEKINLHPPKITIPIISDGKIEDIDKTGEIEHESFNINLGDTDLFYKFNEFIRKLCSPFAPHDSSDRMKTSLYKFFKEEFKFEKYDSKVQRIILGEGNVEEISSVIVKSKEKYSEWLKDLREKREVNFDEKWEVPKLTSYTKKYEIRDFKGSIMNPLYLNNPSGPETNFMLKLSDSKKIDWWYKNGESESKFFAVYYKDEAGKEKPFYVDFIIKFKDGKIGLFDTKEGRTLKEAGPRSKGLYEYIKSQNKKNKNLFGGIINERAEGVWLYNDSEEYNPENQSNWKTLSL